MMTITIRQSTPSDSQAIINLWHDTIKATHHFLSNEDFHLIHQELSSFIPNIPVILAMNAQKEITGFMILNENHIEALFINHTLRKQGIGKALIAHALSQHAHLTTTVNEQNTQAVDFYKHLDFQQTHRTDHDQQNRPYPLLYLTYTDKKQI
ncbi:acetyltransferase [Commensalibacter nepenthis]|uniref:Acetyltransferase n=1 Tax=Commensalibacter nepenthis TaxID=3043872 RepID=A0ABT6Q8D6_9PROT|nr:acetyltransferase [Commensalibacter sp. TBRC 10068]MDI2113168.1 acetyltransferase [Commensalibacter sp. TBRC 10068]